MDKKPLEYSQRQKESLQNEIQKLQNDKITIEKIIIGAINFLYSHLKRQKILLNCIIDKGSITNSSDDLDVLELIDIIIEKYNKGFIAKCLKK